MTAPRLLLVDDDKALASMLREFLELQGFSVEVLHEGSGVLSRIEADPPDLLVLDVMLPGSSGFEILRQIRERRDVPVIMLTARGEESERILGLIGGADDYLAKPCNPLELVARIQAVLKRARGGVARAPEVLVTGPLRLDMGRRELTVRGRPVALTAAELRLLEQLMRHAGQVLSRSRLTQLALDRPIEAYDRSVDTLVSNLRRKLATAGVGRHCIRGLRGHGYVLDEAIGRME